MKIAKGTLILLMVAVMILVASQFVLAGRDKQIPGGPGVITTYPQAPGWVVPAVLALHYVKAGPQTCSEVLGPDVKMGIFMRLEPDKKTFLPFGTTAYNLCYWHFQPQQAAIEDLIRDKVIPFLYNQGYISRADACFAIKDAGKVVDDIGGDFCDEAFPVFSVIDFELAIDDRNSCPPPPGP